MTRYRLHPALGHGELDDAGDSTIGTVAFRLDGVDSLVYLPRSVLTEVEQALQPEPPEPEGELFVMDFPNAKIVPSLLVQKTFLGWVFVGGNAPDTSNGRPYRAGGPYTWRELRARHPRGVLTPLVRAAANQAEREATVHPG